MANSTSIQVLVDGPSKVVVKLEGILDTSDVSSTTVVDPALLSSVDPTGSNYLKATKLRIDKIQYDIEDGLAVNLFWDATTPVRIESLAGRERQKSYCFGGLQNNAGTFNSQGVFTPAAGFTGKITYTTQGWTASAVLSFNVIIEMTKQF